MWGPWGLHGLCLHHLQAVLLVITIEYASFRPPGSTVSTSCVLNTHRCQVQLTELANCTLTFALCSLLKRSKSADSLEAAMQKLFVKIYSFYLLSTLCQSGATHTKVMPLLLPLLPRSLRQ